MSALPVILGIIFVAGGCVAASITPSVTQLASAKQIVIVPVEPPPLIAPGLAARPVGAELGLLATLPESAAQPGGRILASVGGIVMLIQAAAAGRSTGEPRRLDDVLADPATWLPTRALANEAAARLREDSARTVIMTTKYLRLPVGDRAMTWHMENWYKPIRAWFNDDNAGVGYEELVTDHGVILEIGLITYEWHGPYFWAQVLMKVVDPRTGQVIGRARHFTGRRKVGPFEEVLANDVAPLKEIFAEVTRPPVAAMLQDLGLIRGQSAGP